MSVEFFLKRRYLYYHLVLSYFWKFERCHCFVVTINYVLVRRIIVQRNFITITYMLFFYYVQRRFPCLFFTCTGYQNIVLQYSDIKKIYINNNNTIVYNVYIYTHPNGKSSAERPKRFACQQKRVFCRDELVHPVAPRPSRAAERRRRRQ